METIFHDKHVILGITGSIASYKVVDLASQLAQAGALVDSILTASATKFVTPLTFQSVTGRKVYTDEDLWGKEGHVIHIGLSKKAHLLVIAPATANTIAKLAHGVADNLLTVTTLAAPCPLMIAPAMDAGMYSHPATQSNIEILRDRGAHFAGPVEGHLASGMVGKGRMIESNQLFGHVRLLLSRPGTLRNRKVIVTAGGTQEPIDPVRFISNRSSGKQGFALAQAALDRGAEVTLITAPTYLATPTGADRIDVNTAQEMFQAVLEFLPKSDILLMAAAVADFRPSTPAQQKIKRKNGISEINLEPTPDILAAVAQTKLSTKRPLVIVGFAAESQNLIDNALSKLKAQKLDLIVANDITATDAGFEVDTNRVTILDAGGGKESLALLSKAEVADHILERVKAILPD
jgi:phosphopantothenoylcysteine decarboxylase/phosphopantothenate--cysteine ligase